MNARNPKDTIRQGFTAWEVKKRSDMYDGLWILYECLNHSLTNVYLDIVLEIISISKILFIVARSSLRRPQLLFISLKRRYIFNSLNNSVIYATRQIFQRIPEELRYIKLLVNRWYEVRYYIMTNNFQRRYSLSQNITIRSFNSPLILIAMQYLRFNLTYLRYDLRQNYVF